MITYFPEPKSVDPMLQRLVRRCLDGQATAQEIEDARHAAGLSALELRVVQEFLKREMATTFIGDVLHPVCGC